MEKYDHVLQKLEQQLTLISKENIFLWKKAKQSIPLCINALEELKLIVNKTGFKSKQEEIQFFKEFKPNINSKLIYYIQIFNIESKKPIGTEKQLKKYFATFLKEINNFKNSNLNFYKYYQSEGIYLDEKFFIRNDFNLHLILDPNTFNYDVKFNTSHDQKVAQIISNHLLNDYIQSQLDQLEGNLFAENAPKLQGSPLKWTDSKVALIELMYALHTNGSFNQGALELKELAQMISTVFNIDLGEFYRTWSEIKIRKDPTKYLDALKVCLENKIKVDLQ